MKAAPPVEANCKTCGAFVAMLIGGLIFDFGFYWFHRLDAALNALGKVPINEAHVLITTQQNVEKRLNLGAFGNAKQFFYQGRARAVRIWAESYLPRAIMTLTLLPPSP